MWKQKSHHFSVVAFVICRDNRIRTCDPQLPKLVR